MLTSDTPIQKAEEDVLNRKRFAENLAKVMVEYEASDAFTIGLYGPWGSGKTSVINMVLEAIETLSEDVVIFRFNPWLCSDSKQLITQFFRQLAATVKMKKKSSDKLWETINKYSDVLEATGSVPVIGAVLSGISKAIARKAEEHVDEAENNLQGNKDQIIKYLLEERLRIIVMIDDIDRLPESEIIAVFQLIKSLADFPNTMYLLAFDYDVVVKALERVQRGDGVKYLQKIIQVPFALPEANSNRVQNILFDKLNTIISDVPEHKWDKEAWVQLYQCGMKFYIRSIRDVIRYTNVFALKYELLKNETDPVDLMGLTCLQVFEPHVYEALPFYKEAICGGNSDGNSGYQKEKLNKLQEIFDEIAATANADTRLYAGNILKFLFPKLNSSWNRGRLYHYAQFYVHKNVAVPDFFNRYFSLTLEPDEMPASVVENLIYTADDITVGLIIRDISNNGNITKLLEVIEAYSNQGKLLKLTSERAVILVNALVKQWETFRPQEEHLFFSTPFAWHLLFCVEPLLEIMNEQQRFQVMRELFLDVNISAGTLALLLRNFDREHNRFVAETKEHEKQLLSMEQVLELEKLFAQQVCAKLENGTLLQCDGAVHAFKLFEQIAPDLAKEKTRNLIANDKSLALFVHGCIGHGKAATHTVFQTWDVDLDTLSQYIQLNEVYRRLIQFSSQQDFLMLPQAIREDIAAFFIKMEQQQDGKGIRETLGIRAEQIQSRLQQLCPENI